MQSEPVDASRDNTTTPDLVDRMPVQPPIHRIPYELLADIMLCVLPNSSSDSNSDLDETIPSQILRLCGICSRKKSVPLNELFLRRSAPLPITVSFAEVVPPRKVVAALASAAHRWKNFRMFYEKTPVVFGMVFLATIAAAGVHNIEKIHLVMPWPALALRLDMFQHAPRLRGVHLEAHGRLQWQMPSFPWAQLTNLSLHYHLPQVCLDVIVHCENIVHVAIVTGQCQTRRRDRAVNHMKELTILMSICLPPALNAFLPQTPRLEYISLSDCIVLEDVLEILKHISSLTHLHLDSFHTGHLEDEFFKALGYDPTASDVVLVPKLETLDLRNVGILFSEESLAEMIESRWWSDEDLASLSTPLGVARLKEVGFRNDVLPPKRFSKAFRKKMKRYQSQGFEWNKRVSTLS
ncbi:hypothetical protein C8R45DRAFT_1066659 [Mycena sanguinolenta]|nr:hypothetical protein C8R45DRAFT_1066659 [Mycena sanguinolenta]